MYFLPFYMKLAIIISSFFIWAQSEAQHKHPYFLKNASEIRKILSEMPVIEIMEDDSIHIHAVDDVQLSNLIFYFDNKVCTTFVTTHQVLQKYDKIQYKLNSMYGYSDRNEWLDFLDIGFNYIYLQRRTGFFLVKENFSVFMIK